MKKLLNDFFFLCQFKPLTLAISIMPLRKKLRLETELLQSEIVNSCSHISVQKWFLLTGDFSKLSKGDEVGWLNPMLDIQMEFPPFPP